MSITKFGNNVRLEVLDGDRKVVFTTSELRVDFEVVISPGMNRAKFTIYNLAPDTISTISHGIKYCRLYVQLHDRAEQELGYDFFVNNSITIKQVPNSMTELYCISTVRKDFTSKQVQLKVEIPTLKRYCTELARAVNKDIRFEYVDFPPKILDYVPPSPNAVWSGTVLGALQKLGSQYSFSVNEEADNLIKLIYLPLAENQTQSGQNSRPAYTLETVNMRSNPRIGIAELQIESNLDLNIKAGTILDTSDLLTASTLDGFDFLTLVGNQVKSPTSGNSKFVTLTVEHKGSNFTNQWTTTASAVKAIKGTNISTCE